MSFIYIFQVHFCSQSEGFINKKPILQLFFSFWVIGIARSYQTWFYQAFCLMWLIFKDILFPIFVLYFNRHIPKIGLNRHIPIFVDHNLPQRSGGYIYAPSPMIYLGQVFIIKWNIEWNLCGILHLNADFLILKGHNFGPICYNKMYKNMLYMSLFLI